MLENDRGQIVLDGIRKSIRLTGFRGDPYADKWVQDEFDIINALEVVTQFFKETQPMVGLQMYKGQPFDPVEDVKRSMEEYLLAGRNQQEIAANRRRHLTLYHILIEPTIDLFQGISHETILDTIDDTISNIVHELCEMNVSITHDDAIVAREQVRVMVREREARRKAEIFKKRKVRRKPRVTKEVSDVTFSTESEDWGRDGPRNAIDIDTITSLM